MNKLKIAILWNQLTSYFSACLRELHERYQVDLLVFRIANVGIHTLPYQDALFSWLPRLYTIPTGSTEYLDTVWGEVSTFSPNVTLVSGWSIPVYRKVSRMLRKRGSCVLSGLDNPWRGTIRQWLGVLVARPYIHSLFNALWVPGERAGVFARKLGYSGYHLLYGLYSADRPSFERIFYWRMNQSTVYKGWPRRFLFVGRYTATKGIPDLLAAYQLYRKEVKQPWELWCAGAGPLETLIEDAEGVRNLGFVQPDRLSALLRQCGVFVLPSRYEPWGVVIHEAATTGMPVLCSRQCGSSVELVQEGFNGFRFEAGDVNALTQHMIQMSSSADGAELKEMGVHSFQLSERISPRLWADTLISHLHQIGCYDS